MIEDPTHRKHCFERFPFDKLSLKHGNLRIRELTGNIGEVLGHDGCGRPREEDSEIDLPFERLLCAFDEFNGLRSFLDVQNRALDGYQDKV